MMLPFFQNRKMWFPIELKGNPDFEELMSEIKGANYDGPKSKYDDGLDLISMIGAMEVNYPAERLLKGDIEESEESKFWGRSFRRKTMADSASSYTM
jgi:hypothetical protein